MTNRLAPHPEAPDNKGWTHVAFKQEPPPPPPDTVPINLGPLWWMLGVAIGMFAGMAIASGWQSSQIAQSNQRADRAESRLDANQQAINAFCKGVAK